MPRIIRERYENGVLIERTIEGSNFNALALADARACIRSLPSAWSCLSPSPSMTA